MEENENYRDNEKLFWKYETVDDHTCVLLSHVTIIVKQSIHTSKINHSLPSYTETISKTTELENLEKQIALRKSKLHLHLRK